MRGVFAHVAGGRWVMCVAASLIHSVHWPHLTAELSVPGVSAFAYALESSASKVSPLNTYTQFPARTLRPRRKR